MSVSKHQILAALAGIEKSSPLFFGDMPVADDRVRHLFAAAMATLSASRDFAQATSQCKEVSMLATLTHVMLEAAYLRHQLDATVRAAHGEAGRALAKAATH